MVDGPDSAAESIEAPPIATEPSPVQAQRVTQEASDPITMKSLLESGVHFGHQTRRWNPRMKQFIFATRNGIHIIDLQQTLGLLERACDFVREVAATGETILFVGTKRQAQDNVVQEAQRVGAFYVDTRWLGGTFTNFPTIQKRIDYLVQLEERKLKGQFNLLPKREAQGLEDQIVRLNRYFGGIKSMTKLPGAICVIDIGKEKIAVTEARKVGVPVIALIDTDGDPNVVDLPIPGNDDAIRSIRLVVRKLAQAYLEGTQQRLGGISEPHEDEPSTGAEEELALASTDV